MIRVPGSLASVDPAGLAPGMDLNMHLRLWRAGIPEELQFWEHVIATRGAGWADGFDAWLAPVREINPDTLWWVDDPFSAKLLDVGSGPVTVLGTHHQGRRVDVTACDPLARFYADIMARHRIEPQLTVRFGFAEGLSDIFGIDQFDLVQSHNALDHAFDPWAGVVEMLRVTKPGGRVLLGHTRNEGTRNDYLGLHQWNLDVQGDQFIVWSRDHHVNVTEKLAPYADVDVFPQEDGWLHVRLHKRNQPPRVIRPLPEVEAMLSSIVWPPTTG